VLEEGAGLDNAHAFGDGQGPQAPWILAKIILLNFLNYFFIHVYSTKLIEIVYKGMRMKITYRGDYALKAVLDLALHYGKELSTINDIAKRIDAPIKFMEQVLLELKKGGFVESRRGKVGGFLLAKAPNKITVGDVVRFVDGPIEPIACVKQGYSDCRDAIKCVFKKVFQDVAQATLDVVDNVTFEDLVARVEAKKRALEYAI
jgi:Rrf2 family protein